MSNTLISLIRYKIKHREAFRNGTLSTEGVRRVLKLEPNKMGRVADFFVREISEATPRAPISQQIRNDPIGNNCFVFVRVYSCVLLYL